MQNKKYVSWIIFIISFHGLQGILFPGATVRVAIQLILLFVIAYLLYVARSHLNGIDFDAKKYVILYIGFGVFVFLHSAYVSETYEQWRFLVTVYAPTIFFGIFCIFGAKFENFILCISMLLKITVGMSFIFWINGPADKNSNSEYLRYISFSYLLIIISPLVSKKVGCIGFLLAVLGVYFDASNRSHILNVISSTVIVVFYYSMLSLGAVGLYFSKRISVVVSVLLIAMPLAFVVLGGSGVYNVFEKIEESSDLLIIDSGDGRKNNVDSRTVIYKDAYNSINNISWIFGNGATYKYETGLAESLEDYSEGRLGASESFIIGHFMFGGVFYAMSFFFIIINVVYFGIYKSNSILANVLSVFAAFKWFFSFIESPLDFNIYWIVTFMVFGVVLSAEFRAMTDGQIKQMFNKIGNF